MKKKLLTIDDLYNFYSTKKKSMNFSADKAGYNIAVQVNGKFEIEQDDNSEGLLYGKIRAFHDLGNRNKSYIETDILEQYLPSMKDRPIMADIIEVEDEDGNIVKDFNGHTMELDEENDKIIYIEKPVGHFVNPESFHLEWSDEYQRNFVMADVVIYEEYTDACDILRRRQETDCSVELCIRDMSYDCKTHELHINNFYVQGCTLLGAHVQPGMAGSKLSLKDFSEENNSVFSNLSETEETNQKLIETLEKLNNTLANFNINDSQESNENYGKEEENVEDQILVNEEVTEESTVESTEETKVEEEVTETESTEEVTETETENESEETVDESTPEVVETEGCKKKKCSENEKDEESNEVTETEGCKKKKCEEDFEGTGEVTETEGYKKKKCDEETFETIEKTFEVNGRKFSVSFTLSHEDIRYGLYGLIAQYEELDNDWYDIRAVYDDYFVFQGWFTNKIYGCKYTKDGDTVALDGERYNLHEELLTDSEYAQLNDMRSNYSSISEKLASYELEKELADKVTVFEDKAYANYLDTDEFKSLMSKETMKQFSKKELEEKADAALGKLVKATKTFAFKEEKVEKKPNFVSFAATTSKEEGSNAFLDGLRDIGRNKK